MATANVSIYKQVVGNPEVAPGSNVVFKIIVSNISPLFDMSVTNVQIQDILPVGFTPVSWAAVYTMGATGPATGVALVSSISTLPAGSTVTYTYTVKCETQVNYGLYKNRVFVSVGLGQQLIGVSETFCEFSVVKPVVNLTVAKTGPVSVKPGDNAQYLITIVNTSTVDVVDGWLSDVLPNEFYVCGFGVPVGGTINPVVGLAQTLFSVPASSTLIVPLNVVVGVNACLGAATNKITLTLPSCFVFADGSNCVFTTHVTQVVALTTIQYTKLKGCLDQFCQDDPTAGSGFVTVELVSECAPRNPVSGQVFVNTSLQFPVVDGCWESCSLPINRHIKSCGVGAVPTFYNVIVTSTSAGYFPQVVGSYKLKLDSSAGLIVNVDELSSCVVGCV